MIKNRFAHLFSSAKAEEDEEEKKNHQAVEDDDEKKDEELEEEDEKKESDAENSDEDDEEKAEEEESPEARKARKAERARCSAIFASKHASGRVQAAAHLAFNTGMSAKAAIGLMATLPKDSGGASSKATLDQRMQSVANPQVGSDAPAGQDQSTASRMLKVYNEQGV